jgi:hypothetical protein
MDRNDLLIGGKPGGSATGAGSSGRVNAIRQLGSRKAEAAFKRGEVSRGEINAAGKGRGFNTAAQNRLVNAGAPGTTSYTL